MPLFVDSASALSAAATAISDAELAEKLLGSLGPEVTGYVAGVSDARAVSHWATGDRAPNVAAEVRLRALYRIVLLLQSSETDQTVRAWLQASNPRLGGRSPAEVLREGDPRPVLAAAYGFLEA
jgi:hypothetical protein